MENIKNTETLLFSGGAMKCVSILGSLQYLFEKEIIKSNFEGIKDIYFVSGSSIYITPLLLGFSMDSTIDLFKKIDYREIYKSSNEMNIQNLFNNFGLKKISEFKYVMDAIFRAKNIKIDITLKEFYELKNINIHFRVINLNKEKTEYLNKDNSPNLKYIDAITMTSCIPLLFEPIEYNGCKYIDGGVNNNFPYEIISKDKKYIGINILSSKISLYDKGECDGEECEGEEKKENDLNDITKYLYTIYNIYGAPPMEKPSINHIKLLIDGTGVNFDRFSSVISETILLGYNTTKEHFSNFQKHNDSGHVKNED